MPTPTRKRTLSLAAVLIVVGFPASGKLPASTQEPKKTTMADKTYGEDGTVESWSGSKGQLTLKIWKDKDGSIRKKYFIRYELDKVISEAWFLYDKATSKPGDDKPTPKVTYVYENGALREQTEGNKVTASVPVKDHAQVEEIIEKIEKGSSLAEAAAPPQAKSKTDDPTPPNLKWNESPNQPTETKPESKPEDPKNTGTPKQEPNKEETPKETPKTDKTATGESSGTTAPTSLPQGYKLNPNNVAGLDSWTLTTPYGDWRVNFPADAQLGEPFTGTIFLDPVGKDDSERAKNLSKLQEHKLAAGEQIINPFKYYGESLYLTGNGRTTLRGGYRMFYDPPLYKINLPIPTHHELPPPPTEYEVPTGGQQGGLFNIPGPFDGTVSSTDFVIINGERVPIISESPRSRVVWNTSKILGQTSIEINENGQTGQCPFHNVSVSLLTNAPIHLKRGQTADVTITFSGLGSINQDVPYWLVNHSPGVVHMQGGQESQNRMIPASKIADPNGAQGGTYTDKVSITGWEQGTFVITATVLWKETCSLPPEAMHKK